VEICALCDLLIERAEDAAKKYNLPNAVICTDYREVINNPDIDIVYVLTPNVSHCELTVESLKAGKNVMCEKPMAASVGDAEKMMAAWEKSGKLLTIGYQNRFRPDSITLKRLCAEGELGEIYYAQSHALRRRGVPTWGVFTDKSKQGGGPLIDLATHSLDLTLWFMNNYTPKSVVGVTFEKLGHTLTPNKQGNFLGVWDEKTYDVEDAAFAFVTMKDGSLITIDASWVINSTDERCAASTLCGTLAGAELTGIGGKDDGKLYLNKVISGKQAEIDIDVVGAGVDYFAGSRVTPADLECKQWLDALDGIGELVVKPGEAFIVSKILDAVYESAKTGKQITFE
jgi:predicted dehydrogenase